MNIIHFADLHLGVESYSHIDAATGLPSRLIDILASLDRLVGYALNNGTDLVIFSGDAYKNREPTQTHQRELAKRIGQLSEAGVPVLLLIGNHDLPNASGRATSTEIFSTLAVRNVYVSSRPEVLRIETKSGPVQVASMPWVRRGSLLSREDARGLNFEQINERLQAALTSKIAELAGKLDPSIPSVLAAHVWVANAMLGTEKTMTIGQEHTLLISTVASPAFDYVALGHIHRGQVLNEKSPPVVYSGSLARLDFGDEDCEKGFYVVDIETSGTGARRVSYRFHPVENRRFLTVRLTIDANDPSPTDTVVRAIEGKSEAVHDAIVRVHITVPSGIRLNDAEIRNALKPASFSTIAREVQREARVRLGKFSADEMAPLDALKLWLETKQSDSEHAAKLLEYAKALTDEE